MRSARATILRLAIDTSRLRGCWLVLATDSSSEVQTYTPPLAPACPAALVQASPLLSAPAPEEGGDDKIVVLSGPRGTRGERRCAGAPQAALQVFKV